MPIDENLKDWIPSDQHLFPFGKYKGKPYGIVPTKYLAWACEQDWLGAYPEVRSYAKKRMVAEEDSLDDQSSNEEEDIDQRPIHEQRPARTRYFDFS